MLSDYQERLEYPLQPVELRVAGDAQGPGELRLSRMRRLLRRLGDPHVGLKIIHVAGTKGKGSTAAMMAAALTASGVRHGSVLLAAPPPPGGAVLIDGKPASAAGAGRSWSTT